MKNDTLFPLYNKDEGADTPHPPPQVSQDGSASRVAPRHARRVYIETYGCQMNVSDSELMAGILTQSGHQTVPHLDDADVVLVNTCAIRENAETKVIKPTETSEPSETSPPRTHYRGLRLYGATPPRPTLGRRTLCRPRHGT